MGKAYTTPVRHLTTYSCHLTHEEAAHSNFLQRFQEMLNEVNDNFLVSWPHIFFFRFEIIAFLLSTNLIMKHPDCLGYKLICKPET